MVFKRRRFLAAGGAAALSGCTSVVHVNGKGPRISRIAVHKGARRMYLIGPFGIVRMYRIQLGFAPAGRKQFRGDGKTPEGRYRIDRKNPDSAFHLSLGISYPNAADRAFARAHGKSPGGDIFIHGGGAMWGKRSRDWTVGCIAVTDSEMDEIFPMIEIGTPIDILA